MRSFFHPDKYPGMNKTHEEEIRRSFQRVQSAYERLSKQLDPKKREDIEYSKVEGFYDEDGKAIVRKTYNALRQSQLGGLSLSEFLGDKVEIANASESISILFSNGNSKKDLSQDPNDLKDKAGNFKMVRSETVADATDFTNPVITEGLALQKSDVKHQVAFYLAHPLNENSVSQLLRLVGSVSSQELSTVYIFLRRFFLKETRPEIIAQYSPVFEELLMKASYGMTMGYISGFGEFRQLMAQPKTNEFVIRWTQSLRASTHFRDLMDMWPPSYQDWYNTNIRGYTSTQLLGANSPVLRERKALPCSQVPGNTL